MKRNRKWIARLLAGLLAAVFCLGTAATAFAATGASRTATVASNNRRGFPFTLMQLLP